MLNQIIPCCLFPTTVIFIDDNKEFLKSASLCLSEDNVCYRFFSTPTEALAFLKNEYKDTPFTDRSIKTNLPQKAGQETIDFKVQNLYREIYNPNRFKQIATIIADYDMPEMDGITFFQNIKHLEITKVLLTAAADEYLAVKAFNEGAINQFLQKQQENIFQTLNQLVVDSQYNYFQKLSRIFHNSLTQKPHIRSAIIDPAFKRLFEFHLAKYNIVEFYQLETIGSFLLVDEEGQCYTLFLQSEDEVNANYLEIKNEPETLYPQTLKAEIQTGKQIFCFNGNTPPMSAWKDFLYPGTKLEGNQNFYYSLAPKKLSTNEDQLLTFKDFKVKHLVEVGAECLF